MVESGGVVFFSGRRRHTRFSRDWSSDVCSSDLLRADLFDRMVEIGLLQPLVVRQAGVVLSLPFAREFAALDFFQHLFHALLGIGIDDARRSEEHTSELQSRENLVCRLLLEKKKK